MSDLISGLVPFYYKLEESYTRYIIAFAAGTMLGAVFFEMLPELQPADSVYIGAGFFLFYLLERLTMIHSCREYECTSEVHRIGWLPVLGMASDNIIDGVGIAIAYLINPITGIIVALSVIVYMKSLMGLLPPFFSNDQDRGSTQYCSRFLQNPSSILQVLPLRF